MCYAGGTISRDCHTSFPICRFFVTFGAGMTCQLENVRVFFLGISRGKQQREKKSCNCSRYHRTKKRICIKFAWCKYDANMKFAKLCNLCKGGNGRICTKTGKFGHCHICNGCKALQISYLQHICSRQIWGKFNFSSSVFSLKIFL